MNPDCIYLYPLLLPLPLYNNNNNNNNPVYIEQLPPPLYVKGSGADWMDGATELVY